MIEENKKLNEKVTQLEHECEIVKWYMATLERGVDTVSLVKENFALQKEHEDLQKTTNVQINNLEREEKRLTKELKAAMA